MSPRSQAEWERMARASLDAAHERRRRTRADPYAVAGWLVALAVAMVFWGLVTLVAITLL